MLTVTSVVSLVQSHVYHTQHAPLMAAHFQHIMQVPQRRLILVLYFRQKKLTVWWPIHLVIFSTLQN